MKRSIIIAAFLAGIMFFGCSKDNSVVNPGVAGDQHKVNLIKIPGSGGLGSEGTNTFTFNVNGWEGAYQTMYLNFPNSNATVSANYTFPRNVFSGQKTIAITFNNDYASASYSPSPLAFAYPVNANITYSNLNLNGINPSTVKFVYMLPNGGYEPVACDRVDVVLSSGTIKVVNAKLNHFSRYGLIEDPQP